MAEDAQILLLDQIILVVAVQMDLLDQHVKPVFKYQLFYLI